jgi:hypothetical protein
MRTGLLALVTCIACTLSIEAGAVTWRFDFTSPRGSGFFEVDPTNFVIPESAASPTNFVISAADILIDNTYHYTTASVLQGSCAPGECRAIFEIGAVVIPQFGTYNALLLQLNFERIWVPWINTDQRTIQMWQHTDPYLDSLAWNDVAHAERTIVADPSPVPLPRSMALQVTGVGLIALFAWLRRRRINAASQLALN